MKKYIVTPSLTSLNQTKMSNRRYLDVRLDELRRLRLKEISLFVTTVGERERGYIKKQLLKTSVASIPHVHLRSDMSEAEAAYYYERYNTRKFTIHHKFRKNFIKWSPELRRCIGVENNTDMLSFTDMDKFGGMVIDLSHYIFYKVYRPKLAPLFEKAVNTFPILANHASGIIYKTKEDTHWIFSKANFDYLKDIPKKCFSGVISLEVGNSFGSQMRYASYINKFLPKL